MLMVTLSEKGIYIANKKTSFHFPAHVRNIFDVSGAGFAGLACAKALRKFDGEVVLVDRTNHHLFQPLLYQVATAGLSGSDSTSRGVMAPPGVARTPTTV